MNLHVFRPVHSSQHLRTRLGRFWDNHFNTESDVRVKLGSREDAHESDTFLCVY